MITRVVNVRTESPDVYIGRGSPFGNPYRVCAGRSRADAISRYRHLFYDRINDDPEFKRQVLALRGKVLGCHCKPLDCHGDVIAGYLNKPEGGKT